MTALPNYLIIGTQRGGTSALARGISNHPDVFLALGKEMHFFDREYADGIDAYRRHFADSGGAVAVGEATPDYMYIEEARVRMAADLDDVRFIVILRDPVARAYSAYWHNRRRGNESLGFEEALAAEEERLEGSGWGRYRHGYMDRGRYVDQLRRIAELMPEAPLLVLFNDELRTQRRETLHRVWKFVNVDPELGDTEESRRPPRKSLVRRLKAKVSAADTYDRSYEPMSPTLRSRLVAEMDEANTALETHLGLDLSHWRT